MKEVKKDEALEALKNTPAEKIQIFKAGVYENYDVEIKAKYNLRDKEVKISDKCLVVLIDMS